MDPYERADVVIDQHYDWTTKNAYLLSYGVMKMAEFLETFVDYPPSQIRSVFTIDQIEEDMEARSKAKIRLPHHRSLTVDACGLTSCAEAICRPSLARAWP